MAFPQLVNTGAFTQANLNIINSNFGVLAGAFGGGVFGKQFYVDPVNGTDNNDGSANFPVATIARAIGVARSGYGDTIVIAPGEYDETVVLTKDYVMLVGGTSGGYARPDWGPGATTEVPLTIRAQGVILQHIRFFADASDAVRQEGNGFLHTDCVFDGDGTATMAGLRLRGNSTDDSLTASEGQVLNNYFRGSAIGVALEDAAVPSGVGSTDNWIANNRFSANTIDIATVDGGGGVSSVATITIGPNNQFIDKNKTCYIDMTTSNGGAAGAQTGAINGNYFAADAITAGNQVRIVGTGFTFTGNYNTVGVKDGSGLD